MNLSMLVALSMGICAGATIGTSLSVLFFDEYAGLIKKMFYAFQLAMGVTLTIVIWQYGTQIWKLFGQ